MTTTTSCNPSDRLMQTLKVRAPGATDEVIKLELFNVMDEFYRRTSAWRHTQDIQLEPSTSDYDVDVPNGSVVVRLMAVEHQGVPVPSAAQRTAVTQSSLGTLLPELTFPDGDATFLPAESDLDPSDVFSYAIYRPDYISVTAIPDEEGRRHPMKVVWALSLSPSCLECDCGDWESVPDWHWDMFFQDLLDGALSRLYSMPAKPWSSDKHTLYHGKRFRNAMAFRKQEAMRGFAYGVPAWRFPRGW